MSIPTMTRRQKSWTIGAMASLRRRVRWLAWPLAGWLLAACAPARPPLLQLEDSYSRQAAEDIYTVGYRNISEKYIETVPVARLALEGLRGLASIDPSLTVKRSASHVTLSYNNNQLARYPAPGDDDVRAWAQLTTNITTAGRGPSQTLRDAKPEKVYEAVFDGIISGLDAFSRYAGAVEAERNRSNRDGFGGVGIRFTVRNGQVPITMIMPGSPAAKAGLKVDDRITQVGTIPVENLKSYEIAAQLRGPVESHVVVAVNRGDPARRLRFDVERKHIVPTTVTNRYQDGIVDLTISGFNRACRPRWRTPSTATARR
jgi:carboxyl-terminal processing protease